MFTINKARSVFFYGLVVIIAIGAVVLYDAQRSIVASVKTELIRGVSLAAAAMNEDDLSRLSFTEADNAATGYQNLRQQFERIGSVLRRKSIRGIYAMKVLGGEVRFIADSAPTDDPWHSEPGVVYLEPPAEIFAVQHTGTDAFVGPYSDEYGSFFSVFVPFIGNDGLVAAVVGGDVDQETYETLVQIGLIRPYFIFFSLTIAYLLSYLLVADQLRRRGEQAAKEVEQSQRAEERAALLMNVSEGVVACDVAGKVVYINEAAQRMIGKKSGECVGQKITDIWTVLDNKGEPLPDDKRPLAACVRGETALDVGGIGYVSVRRTDGSTFPAIFSLSSVKSNDQVQTCILSFRDFSKEAEVDRIKSDFISVAAHQIKTPLTALKWTIGMMEEDTKKKRSPKDKEVFGQLVAVVAHLDDLVRSLLNVTRVESGRIMIEAKLTDLKDLVEEAVKVSSVRATEKNQKFEVVVSPAVPRVAVDQGIIREVYKNLLTNAVKYSPEGSRITVKVEVQGDEIVSMVKDEGYGIPAKDKDRIFDKFYRGKNIVGLDEDGTGLGLYLAKQLVGASGGRIWFESVEGKGTTLWFTLPLVGSQSRTGEVRIG